MVTPSAAALVIRDALARDAYVVTQVLSAAFAETPLGRWLDSDPTTRQLSCLGFVGGLVVETINSGIVRVVEDDGQVIGAALWSLHSRAARASATEPAAPDVDDLATSPVQRRQALLTRAADLRFPPHLPYHRLVYVGVRPERQGQGIGSYLLIGHHALLHVTDTPSFLLADGIRSRRLFERHGYTSIGAPELLPDAAPIWAMWRAPKPADPL
jgi:GNAT superfamily N-acetyltransferase